MKRAKTIKLIAIIILAISLLFGIRYFIQKDLYFWLTAGEYSENYRRIESYYRRHSSDFLIKKLKVAHGPMHFEIAAKILGERKEKKAVKPLLEALNFDNFNPEKEERDSQFFPSARALVKIGTKEAMDGLMDIINKYRKVEHNYRNLYTSSPFYIEWERYYAVMLALSKIRYEPVYPVLLEWVKSKDLDKNRLALSMLANYRDRWQKIIQIGMDYFTKLPQFKEEIEDHYYLYENEVIDCIKILGRAEGIPYLEKIKEEALRYLTRRDAEDAIKYLSAKAILEQQLEQAKEETEKEGIQKVIKELKEKYKMQWYD